MQDDDAYTRESWIEVEARNRSGKAGLERLKNERSNTMAEQTRKCECECEYHGFEQGDTLYFETQWDGGIEFYYIRNIKYCPVCGKELPER